MSELFFESTGGSFEGNVAALRKVLKKLKPPFATGGGVGIKLHWGERGNTSYLPPDYAHEIVKWLKDFGVKPFIFDTTVLYSGGRRKGRDSIRTAIEHGYIEGFLDCPLVIADGMYGRNVMDIPAGYKHFETVQVSPIIRKAHGFVIFSHFKGHMLSGFGGAIKNISMGLASRAQKQRMHSDAHPELEKEKCTMCGICVDHCPVGAAQFSEDGYPDFDLEKCIGCAQCIGLCPQVALKILWKTDKKVFMEKLVETAAAVWKYIEDRTLVINALVNITAECDCMPGENRTIAKDVGFIAGYHPVTMDAESLTLIGTKVFERAHPDVPWQHQFEYAKEIDFCSDALRIPAGKT